MLPGRSSCSWLNLPAWYPDGILLCSQSLDRQSRHFFGGCCQLVWMCHSSALVGVAVKGYCNLPWWSPCRLHWCLCWEGFWCGWSDRVPFYAYSYDSMEAWHFKNTNSVFILLLGCPAISPVENWYKNWKKWLMEFMFLSLQVCPLTC